jgi:hypothetical protein
MSGELKYKISVDDKLTPAVANARNALDAFKGNIRNVTSAFKSGDWSGGVRALQNIGGGASTAGAGFKGLLSLVNPTTLALAAGGVAVAALAMAWKGLKIAVGEAIAFEKHTYQLRTLVGGLREARQVMLQLTEGRYSDADMFFGTDAVVAAYRALHTYSNGAIASAYRVHTLGNAAARTGKDIGQMAEIMGRAWQAITNREDFGRVGMMLKNELRLPTAFVNDLQRMRDQGATAAEIWGALTAEIEKSAGAIDEMSKSVDGLSKRIADAKGTIAVQLGEIFLPLKKGFDHVWVYILEKIADITKNPLRLVLVVTVPGRALLHIEDLYRKMGGKSPYDRFDRKPEEVTDEEFAAMSPADQEATIEKANLSGNAELARKFEGRRANSAAFVADQQAWDDIRKRQRERTDERSMGGATAAQLRKLAGAAETKGDAKRYEELTKLAEKREAEEKQKSAEATAKARAEELALADETAKLRERRKEIADATAAEDATPNERAMWYESEAKRLEAKAAAVRGGRTDSDLTTAEKHRVAELDLAAAEARKNLVAASKTIDKESLDAEKTQRDKVKSERDIARAGLPKDQERDFILKELKSVQDITTRIRGKRDDGQLSESDRATVQDLDSQADDLRKSLKGLNRSLLDDAAAARKDLARMGASKSVQDIGITERFDWLRNVSAKRSPDEEIAEHAREMRKYLAVIAKAEGVQ